jgi:hypothetical protein
LYVFGPRVDAALARLRLLNAVLRLLLERLGAEEASSDQVPYRIRLLRAGRIESRAERLESKGEKQEEANRGGAKAHGQVLWRGFGEAVMESHLAVPNTAPRGMQSAE